MLCLWTQAYTWEIQEDICETTRVEISESAICHFLQRVGFSTQNLKMVAKQRCSVCISRVYQSIRHHLLITWELTHNKLQVHNIRVAMWLNNYTIKYTVPTLQCYIPPLLSQLVISSINVLGGRVIMVDLRSGAVTAVLATDCSVESCSRRVGDASSTLVVVSAGKSVHSRPLMWSLWRWTT